MNRQLFHRFTPLPCIEKIISVTTILVIIFSLVQPQSTASAAASLTITPITWNVVGLDSNNVNVGPNNFPVGARVCNTGSSAATNVISSYVWDSSDPYINLRAGSLASFSGSNAVASLAAGSCTDFYYEIDVTRNSAAYNHIRKYHITAAADGVATVSTSTPREIFVEHLVSQSRNAVLGFELNGVAVPVGGSLSMMVGNTYTLKLIGSTATNGYNQIESFINIPNTIFQVLSTSTTYFVSDIGSPINKLYGDACGWDSDPTSPNYRACTGVGKAGGDVTSTYTIKILSGGGSTLTLSSLLYDFSGSSYHYNSDLSTSAVVVSIVNPSGLTINKNFTPDPTTVGGISTLILTINNPNAIAINGAAFTDTFPTSPGVMKVASTPNATTSGCGSPTFAPSANDTSLSFSNGTIAPNSSCTIKVNVTVSAAGTYSNTTGALTFTDTGGATVNTGNTASDTLTATTAPVPPACSPGLTLASWTMDTSQGTTSPPAYWTKAGNVPSATASSGGSTPLNTIVDTTGNPANSWMGYGWDKTGSITTSTSPYFQFAVDTRNYTAVQMSLEVQAKSNGPDTGYLYYSTDGSTFNLKNSFAPTTSFASAIGSPFDFSSQTSTTGVTYFRIYGLGAANKNVGADLSLDNITFTGCSSVLPPTMTKAFSVSPIVVNGSSTLTFTLSNPNGIALTGVQFSDALPSGLEVANPAAASTTCTSATFSPAVGATSLSFTGASIPANGSCTAQVSIKATTAGIHDNVSGYISSTNGGTNTGTSGIATASLTALQSPSIAKSFSPSPILAGATSTLTLTITNPNQSVALTGVAFSDTFPTSPGNMVVANPTGVSTSGCGSPTFSPSISAGSISFSGGTIAASGRCTMTVNVTAPTAGSYSNTTGSVSSTNAGTGNTASAALTVNPVTPSITILKQVSTSATGPWSKYIKVTGGSNVYYQFTVENTGNVSLSSISVSDPTVSTSGCSFTTPLAAGVTTSCVVGPIIASLTLGTYSNTAIAHGTYSSTIYNSASSTASYALPAPDLSVTKMNNVSGKVTGATTPFNWTLIARNSTYGDTATFTSGQVILRDNLPSGPSYGSVTVTNGTIAPVGTINCAVASNVLTCSASGTVTFAAGASFDATFTVTPVAAGDLVNPPSGGGNVCQVDPVGVISENNETNNTCADTVSVNLPSSPDLRISKSNSSSDAGAIGTAFTWNLIVSNSGTAGATFTSGQTILTDTLPVNATYGSASAGSFTNITNSGNISCGIVGGVLTCTASGGSVTIETDGNFTVSFNATPTAAGSLANTATVDPDGHITEGNETNNTGSNTVTVTANAADLTVAKTNNTTDAGTIGTAFTWTLTVSNGGTAGATFANGEKIVTDTLPVNATYGSASAGSFTNITNSGNISCGIVAGVLTCTASGGTVTIGTSGNFTVSFSATPTAVGSLLNTATVDPDGHITEGNESNNTGSNTVTVTAPELTVAKTNNTMDAGLVGTAFTWTLTVSNGGTAGAAFANGEKIVTDTLPVNATYGSASAGNFTSITNSGNISCAIATGVLTCTASGGTVTIGTSGSFTVSFSTTPTAAGSLANTATVDPDGHVTEGNESNNTGSNTVTVSAPDLTVAKTNNTTDAGMVGTAFTWTLTISNGGTAGATFANGEKIVTDTLPVNATYGSASAGNFTSITNSGNISCGIVAGVLACTASGGTFTIGTSGSFTVSFSTTPTAAGSLANTATVDPDGHVTEGNESNNTSSNTVTVSAPDLTVAKTNNTTNAGTVGTAFTWTLTVSNGGTAGATFANGEKIVTDILPVNATYGSASAGNFTSITNSGNISCGIVAGVLACTASGGTFTIGTSGSFTVSFSTTPTAVGSLANTATVDPDGHVTEGNESNNTGSNTVTVSGPDLTLAKVNNTAGTGTVGTAFKWKLTVTNGGTAGAAFTTGQVILKDNLPSGPTYGSVTVTNGTTAPVGTINCAIATYVLTCTASGGVTLGVAASFDAEFNVTPVAAGNLDNPASGGGNVCKVDPDGHVTESDETNNTATDIVTVTATLSPELTVTKTNNTTDAGTVGTAFTWTLTVSNGGTAGATFANGEKIVTDALPVNATYGSASAGSFTSITNSGFISCAIATGVLTCTASGGTVTIGTSGSFTVSFSATPTATGSLANTATVDPDGHVTEGNESNNTGSNTVTVSGPDLTLAKVNNTAGTGTVGTAFKWKLTVTNGGTAGAAFTTGQVILKDNLPSGPTYGSVTVTNGTTAPVGTINCAIASNVLTCTASGGVTLGVGASFDAEFDVTPVAVGSLQNPVSGGGNVCKADPDGVITESDESNNTATNTVTVTAPDLTLAKVNNTAGAGAVATAFKWKLTVTNGGTAGAAFTTGQVILKDNLPSGPTYGSVTVTNGATAPVGTINCAIASNVLTCTASGGVTLGVAASFDAEFNVTPVVSGNLDNPASGGGNVCKVDPDGHVTESDETNNSDTDTVTVSAADLTVAKTNNTTDAGTVGTAFTWTLTVSNGGTAGATFANGEKIVTDTLPVNATYGSASAGNFTSITNSGFISCAIATGVLTCTASGGTVTIGTSGSFTVSFSATPTATGSLANTATVDPDGHVTEGNESNNTGSNTVTVSAALKPDLTVAKTNNTTDAGTVGTAFTWTLTVSNGGTAGAAFGNGEKIVTDTLPVNATYGSASAGNFTSITNSGFISCAIATGVLTCTASGGTVTIGTSGSFTVSFSTTPTAAGSLANTATVDPDGHVTEGNESNNTGSNTVTVSAPDLTLAKVNNTAGAGTVGTAYKWTLTVSNGGTAGATFTNGQVILKDNLPSGPTYGSVTLTNGATAPVGTLNCAIASNILTCTANGVVTIGTGASFSAEFNVTPATAGSLENPASGGGNVCKVDPDGRVTESNESNNTATDTVTVAGADLTLAKVNNTADAGAVGTAFTWTLTVLNGGTAGATFTNGQVILKDNLPSGPTYGSVTLTNGGTAPVGTINCAIVSNVLTCTASGVVTFGIGASFDAEFDVTPVAAGSLDNPASGVGNVCMVDPDGHVTESDESNNTATDTVVVSIGLTPDLTVAKINNTAGAGVVGTAFTWTLTISNSGAAAAIFTSGQTIISDPLPANTTYGSPIAGSFINITDSANIKCNLTNSVLLCIANGGSVTIGIGGSFTVNISATPTAAGSMVNTVSVDPDSRVTESDETNNTGSSTVNVSQSYVDLAITQTDGIVKTTTGNLLNYSLVYQNNGNAGATGVVVTYLVPLNTVFNPGTSSTGWVCVPSSGIAGSNCTLNTSDIPAGTGGTKTFSVTVNGSLPPGTEIIRGDVKIGDDGTHGKDPTPENNADSDVDLLGTSAKVLISSENHPTNSLPNVSIGEILTYQVLLNIPIGTMSNLVYLDTLDRGLAYLDALPASVSSVGITTLPGTVSDALLHPTVSLYPNPSSNQADKGRRVTYNFGDATSGGDNVLSFRYRVVLLDSVENVRGLSLNNQGTWSWVGSLPVSITASPFTIVEPSMTVNKSANQNTVVVGDTVIYTIKINHSNTSNTDAYNVTLTDKLPDELKYIPGSLVYVSGVIPDTLDESDPKNLAAIWDSYDRGAGETILRYRVTVKSLKPSGIKNTAVLTWSSLPNNFLTAQTANNPLSTERYYDPNSTINIYGASSSFTLNEPISRSLFPTDRNQYLSGKSAQSLPLTGFAPGIMTSLEQQPSSKQYRSLGEIALDLPSLGIKTSVINVPFVDGTWDVKWLNSQAGYLEGTTFPTQKGNTVITAHVYNSDGGPGLFVNLGDLKWGDIIQLHAWGNDYAYEVRSNQQVNPNAISVLGSKKKGTWLTLLTCRGYNEVKNTYQWRIAVQAVLVKITPDQR